MITFSWMYFLSCNYESSYIQCFTAYSNIVKNEPQNCPKEAYYATSNTSSYYCEFIMTLPRPMNTVYKGVNILAVNKFNRNYMENIRC